MEHLIQNPSVQIINDDDMEDFHLEYEDDEMGDVTMGELSDEDI